MSPRSPHAREVETPECSSGTSGSVGNLGSSKQQHRRSDNPQGELAPAISNANCDFSPPAMIGRGLRQPKWCLCFRMDRPEPCNRSSSEVAWKHQRDFFVTVVDPPPPPSASSHSTASITEASAPFFASQVACQIANLLVSRPFLELLKGQSFERKSVAVVGPDCVAAGFVAAMLGARVAFVTERSLLQVVQHNIKLYLKDTLNYTKSKSSNVAAVCAERSSSFTSQSLCEELNAAPPLDVIITTQTAAEACGAVQGMFMPGAKASTSVLLEETQVSSGGKLFDVLGELVPPHSAGKVLLICDGTLSLRVDDDASDTGKTSPPSNGEPLPIESVLPAPWHSRAFCTIVGRIPVVLLERMDAEATRGRKPLTPFRRCLPPMGANSARCGCGGHPQKTFLNHRVLNFEWQANHRRLKEALVLHNRWKNNENAKELEKARRWAATGCRMLTSSAPAGSGSLELTPLGEERGEERREREEGRREERERDSDFDRSSALCTLGDVEPSLQTVLPHRNVGSLANCLHDMGIEFASLQDGDEVPISMMKRASDCQAHSAQPPDPSTDTMESFPSEISPLEHVDSGRSLLDESTTGGGPSMFSTAPCAINDGPGSFGDTLADMSVSTDMRARSSIDLPSVHPPRTPRSRREVRQNIGKLAGDVAKVSTIVQRHSQPPHWYRCNRVPYGVAS